MSQGDRTSNWMQRIINSVLGKFRRRRNPGRRPVILELVNNMSQCRRDTVSADNPGHTTLQQPEPRKAYIVEVESSPEHETSTSEEILLSSHSSGRQNSQPPTLSQIQSDFTEVSPVSRQLSSPPEIQSDQSTSHSGHFAPESSTNSGIRSEVDSVMLGSFSEEQAIPSCSKEKSEGENSPLTTNKPRDSVCTRNPLLKKSLYCQENLISYDKRPFVEMSVTETESHRQKRSLTPNHYRSERAVESIFFEATASRLISPESSLTDDPSSISSSSTLSSEISSECLFNSQAAAKKSNLSRSYPGTPNTSFVFAMPSTSGSVTCGPLPPPRIEPSWLRPIDPQRPSLLPYGEQQQHPEEGPVAIIPFRPEPIPGSSRQQMQHTGRPVEMQPNRVVIRSPRRRSLEVLPGQGIQAEDDDLLEPAAARRRFVRVNDPSPPLNGFGIEGHDEDDQFDEVFAP